MTRYFVTLVNLLALCVAFWATSCKPEADPKKASPQATQTYVSGQYGANPIPYVTATVVGPGGSNALGAPGAVGATGTRRGVGCDKSPDAEIVPSEPGLRECCKKVKGGDACFGSVCWGGGMIAKVRAQMQPGGQCAP